LCWRDKAGRGWYWESEDLGEHRLFSRSGDLAALKSLRGWRWDESIEGQQGQDGGVH
jgi:hypothetical protein